MGAKVDECPNVDFLEFYIEAFFELGTCRVSSMSIGQIPFTAIAEYANIYDVDDFDEFLYVMRVMDNAIIRLSNAGSKRKVTDDKSKSNRR